MKKLVVILCMFGVLFGISVGNFTKQGIEAFDRGGVSKGYGVISKG